MRRKRSTAAPLSRRAEGFRSQAVVALVVSILCWASIPLFLKHFSSLLDAWTLNAYRYSVAAALYLPWLVARSRRREVARRLWKAAVLPTFFNIVSQNLWTWAPYFINPGLMSFLARGSVIWAVTGSFLLFPDERPAISSRPFGIGLSLAAVGYLGLMLQQGALSDCSTAGGILIMLACGVFTAGYALTVRRFLTNTDARVAFAVIALYTAASANALMVIFGHPDQALSLGVKTTLLLILSAVLGLAIAQVAYYVAVARLGVAICSSSMFMTSFLTTLASGLLFGERFTLGQWLAGGLLILGGITLLRSGRYLGHSRPAQGGNRTGR